jgi:hypothetical protein
MSSTCSQFGDAWEREAVSEEICESCGAAVDTFVVATKQPFCLECALALPKGSLPAMTVREKDDHENTDAHL